MDGVSVYTLIERALQKLETNGMAISTLKRYRTTGFGAILRYCEQTGSADYSAGIINEFVLQTRQRYERGEITLGTWQLVRRSGELLKQFRDNGTLDLPPCEKWESSHNPLHCEPTTDELYDDNNIRVLVWRTRNELNKVGISVESVKNYQCYGFDRILRAHMEHGITQYSPELTRALYEETRENHNYKSIKTYAAKCQIIRKSASLLEEYYTTGTLKWNRLSPCALRELCDEYSRLLNSFCDEVTRTGIIKANSIPPVKSAIRGFLFELEDVDIYTFENITLRIISERVTHMSLRYSGGLSTALHRVRIFLKHLYSNGTVKQDLSIAIPEFAANRKSIRPGFSDEEIERLRSSADRTTPLGKRDYAIMTLAAQTGLRACDVTNLKRQDIDWHTNELRIVQEKTGRPLTLPLPIESGNAIADYLLNARPTCDEPYVFICGNRPFRKIQNGSMVCIVSRYKEKTALANTVIKRSGFHSFRRSFGKLLLEAETSLDMLGELLGHEDMDSAKPYIAIDENGLKFCALSLVAPVKAGDLE